MGLLTSAKSDCVSYNVDDAKTTCIDWAEGYLVKFPGDSVNVSVCVIVLLIGCAKDILSRFRIVFCDKI